MLANIISLKWDAIGVGLNQTMLIFKMFFLVTGCLTRGRPVNFILL